MVSWRRVGMVRRGVLAAAAGAALALAGCGTGDPRARDGGPPLLAFGCAGGERFLALFAGTDSVRLVAADGMRVLRRIPAASGERYAGGRDTLWTKGADALLIRGDRMWRGCSPTGRQRVLADLWRSGAVFAAAGNEPFWTLTAWPDSLVLVLDLGATRLHRPLTPGSPWRGPRAGWSDPQAGIAVTVDDGPCVDTMSGAPHPWAVRVRWDGRQLNGCGVDLRPVP